MIKGCEQELGILNLSEVVKIRFKRLASNNKGDFMQKHINYIRSSANVSNIYTRRACSICLLHGSVFALDCQHRLCNQCIAQIGQEYEFWRFNIDKCLLCGRQNQSLYIMRPPTAGHRVLEVSGTNCTMIWQFLKQIQRLISLNSMPFWEHFDSATGKELGKAFHVEKKTWTN